MLYIHRFSALCCQLLWLLTSHRNGRLNAMTDDATEAVEMENQKNFVIHKKYFYGRCRRRTRPRHRFSIVVVAMAQESSYMRLKAYRNKLPRNDE